MYWVKSREKIQEKLTWLGYILDDIIHWVDASNRRASTATDLPNGWFVQCASNYAITKETFVHKLMHLKMSVQHVCGSSYWPTWNSLWMKEKRRSMSKLQMCPVMMKGNKCTGCCYQAVIGGEDHDFFLLLLLQQQQQQFTCLWRREEEEEDTLIHIHAEAAAAATVSNMRFILFKWLAICSCLLLSTLWATKLLHVESFVWH